MSPPKRSFIAMTQSRLANGRPSPIKYRKQPDAMNDQRLLAAKFSMRMTPMALKMAAKPGEYNKVAKRICKVVKYPIGSTSAAVSSRSVFFSTDFAGAIDALEAC